MPYATQCPLCTSYKPPTWTLCYACLQRYGGTVAGWPAWVRLAVNYDRRWRYRDERRHLREITVSDFEALEETGGQLDDPLRTGAAGMAWSYQNDGYGRLLLPFAPYDDSANSEAERPALNRAYRKANGIRATTPAQDTRPAIWDTHRDPDPLAVLDDLEIVRQALAVAQAAMTEKQQQCLALSLEGLTHKEIGERLNISRQSVTQHWANALEAVAEAAREFAP